MTRTRSIPYIELHARSAFSFLRGGSLPEHLAARAAELNYSAMAVCDRDGVYGAPRFFAAGREKGIRSIIGAELTMECGSILPVLVESRRGYQNLCRLFTRAQLRSEKGKSAIHWDELPEFASGLVALTGDHEGPLQFALQHSSSSPLNEERAGVRGELFHNAPIAARPFFPFPQQGEGANKVLHQLIQAFGAQNVFVEIQRHNIRGENRQIRALANLADKFRLPLLATNGVLYALPSGRQVLDVFTCMRHHTHLDAAGKLLARNSERYLKDAPAMGELFHDLPQAIENSLRLAERLEFSLTDLGYEFPVYPVPSGETMDSCLRQQAMAGARARYPVITPKVQRQLDHELGLISKLRFAGYFLIVAEIVKFCRENDIFAQGRGSAANSVVCFSLGITAVDPVGSKLLFERFLSDGRKGWPDIDIDLPSGDRRERVIQEVYRRYGKHGAAMTANVITYRGRSAAREIGKALNVSNDVIDRFSNLFADGDFPHTLELTSQMEQAGLPRNHPRAEAFVSLYRSIHGLPRHLGQHSGGMIICQGQLDSIVPLENASMPGRVVAQWDKEDCEDLGIIKVDLLGLGMMSVIQDALELTRQRGHPVDLAQIPKEDAATFEMMQKADTIGVFQIESRAQMATLPRLKPSCFYDVVVEVAIIRPGPIQGDMVHPYLARRAGREPVTYYDERLRPVLERTLGVPLFQEQLLRIAMVMADFTGSEAEELRRALSFHRSEEKMQKVADKLRVAMAKKGVKPDVIEQILQSITSFALYGFPESHAISFAILAYGSAYLKRHYAPEFYASLLNNQPMGFYSPATIVKDAKRHGLQVRPVCAMRSDWRCTIDPDNSLRLGLCLVQGLQADHGLHLLEERARAPFTSMEDFKSRVPLNKDELRTLAGIGALNCFAEHRRDALWRVEKEEHPGELFAQSITPSSPSSLNGERGETVCDMQFMEAGNSPLLPMNVTERMAADYNGVNLTTGPHPMALARSSLPDIWRASDLPQSRHGSAIRIAGNVICRQRPGTAKGFVFVSLEDETGVSNAIISPQLFDRQRLLITQESFLMIEGRVQNVDNVVLVRAERIAPLRANQLVGAHSHDFH